MGKRRRRPFALFSSAHVARLQAERQEPKRIDAKGAE
jgi:hypothetical protein